MSSRRSRGSSSEISDAQINDLVSKLQRLIPQLQPPSSSHHHNHKVSAAKVLKETCDYIKKLHGEVDDLSDRLSELLTTTDSHTPEAAILRTLLM